MADEGTFTWGSGGTALTPEQVKSRRKIAEAMIAKGSSTAPIQHWAQGLDRLASGLLGGLEMRNADRGEAAGRAQLADMIERRLRGSGSTSAAAATAEIPAPTASITTAAQSPSVLDAGGTSAVADAQGAFGPDAVMLPTPQQSWRDAIGSNESADQKNPYAALGPVTPKGDRAHGRYGVMGVNLPEWTKAALGRELTPEEFLADAKAQDAVFDHRFGGYVNQTGNLKDAASLWFTGQPYAQGVNRSDRSPNHPQGITGGTYVERFGKSLVPSGVAPTAAAPAATAFAQEDPAALPPNATPTSGFGPAAPDTVPPGVRAVASAMMPRSGAMPTGENGAPDDRYPANSAVQKIASLMTEQSAAPVPAVSPAVAKIAQTMQGGGARPPSEQLDTNARLGLDLIRRGYSDEGMKLLSASIKPRDYGFQTLPDGTVLRTDPRSGTVSPIHHGLKTLEVKRPGPFGETITETVQVGPNGELKPVQVQGRSPNGGPSGGAPVDPSVTGDDFLKTLEPAIGNQVKAIVEGRMQPPGSFALKSPYWQQMLKMAGQYEPGFDFTKWGQRASTSKDFASGKSAKNITSFNTTIGHLDTLSESAKALKNSWSPAFNTVANWMTTQRGDPRVKEFEVAKTAVTDELTRAFRGTGGNVHDLIQWEKSLEAAGSPEQLQAAIKQAVELLRSRIEAVGEEYNRGMGGARKDPMEWLTPKARSTVENLSTGRTDARGGADWRDLGGGVRMREVR